MMYAKPDLTSETPLDNAYTRQTRALAAKFLKTHRIMMAWHLKIRLEVLAKTHGHAQTLPDHGDATVIPRLPARIALQRGEIALVRGILSDQIDQILFGED